MLHRRLAPALAVVALVTAGCGSDDRGAGSRPSTAPAASATTSDTAAQPTALGFTARMLDGTTLDLSTLADQPVLFWFWAPT